MRRIILIIIVSVLNFCFGQDESVLRYLPKNTPAAPEAFNFTKYGDMQMDEFNGKVNVDIPIFEFTAGALKLPISIGYYGAGVKVMDLPTQVGINWTLNAGGVITRDIKGQADESFENFNLSLVQLNALNQADCTEPARQLRSLIENGTIDKETDIFNFKFGSYSGSFYLDANFNPVLLKDDNPIKIDVFGTAATNKERLNVDKTFLITTPDGVKYFFGGINGCESSVLRSVVNGRPSSLSEPWGITAFYLYKVKHPTNGDIMIDYQNTAVNKIALNYNYSKTRSCNYDANPCASSFCNESLRDAVTENWIFNQKYISKIYTNSNLDTIEFIRTNEGANSNFFTVLNGITFKRHSVILRKVDFNYLGLETDAINRPRFFLSSLNYDSNITDESNKKQVYGFIYNDPLALPHRRSYKVDELGFFNNKNNLNLYPCFDQAVINCPNRTSDFNFASKGTLIKIIYPSKGFTEFEYEHQPLVEKKLINYNGFTYINNSGQLDENDGAVLINGIWYKTHFEMPYTYVDENGAATNIFSTPISYTQTIDINLSASTNGTLPGRLARATLKITNLSTGVSVVRSTQTQVTFSYTFVKDKSYKVELDLSPPTITQEGYTASGNFSFNLHTGYHAPTGYGIRLKSTKNFSAPNAPPDIKRFYYKSINKLDDIFADQIILIPARETGAYLQLCPIGIWGFPVKFIWNTTTLNSNINFLDTSMNIYFRDYRVVTVSYGGDNFENGGIEKTFALTEPNSYYKLTPVSTNISIPEPTEKASFSNANPVGGQLLKEKIFVQKNGLMKVKETVHNYESPIIKQKLNFTSYKFFSDAVYNCGGMDGTHNRLLSNCNMSYYYVNSYDFKKTSQTETNYIDPVPSSIVAIEPSEITGVLNPPTQNQLEATYKKITTTQNFSYGSLKGLPTEITSTTSDGLATKTKNIYAPSTNQLTGLTALQIAANAKLVSQNNIAAPIQVEQYKDNQLISQQRTLYKTWNANPEMVLPEIIQAAKGQGAASPILEDRVVFLEYDAKGNPNVVALKDGTKTKYFYNALNQVTVKIDNFDAGLNIPNNPLQGSTAQALQNSYPSTQISVYNYNVINNQIQSIVSPNGQTMYYEYNALNQLLRIRDNNNNIVQEFDHNYKQ